MAPVSRPSRYWSRHSRLRCYLTAPLSYTLSFRPLLLSYQRPYVLVFSCSDRHSCTSSASRGLLTHRHHTHRREGHCAGVRCNVDISKPKTNYALAVWGHPHSQAWLPDQHAPSTPLFIRIVLNCRCCWRCHHAFVFCTSFRLKFYLALVTLRLALRTHALVLDFIV